jgi:hypothetical protein
LSRPVDVFDYHEKRMIDGTKRKGVQSTTCQEFGMELKQSRFDRLLDRECQVDHLMRQDQPKPASGDMLLQSFVTRHALPKSGFSDNKESILLLKSFRDDSIKSR